MSSTLSSSALDFLGPLLTLAAEPFKRRCSKRTAVALPVGILLASWYLARRLRSALTYRKWERKVAERGDRARANVRKYEDKYPKITKAQESIVSLDVPILKERLRSGSLGATEVLEAFIAKTVQVNKDTNAIVEFIDEALERARALDKVPKEKRGPLHGIPISLKEHIHLEGYDSTMGAARMIDVLSPRDAGLVSLLKSLGAIPFCRTNLPQVCLSFDCSNPIYGATKNPRDLTRSPGGSSGGEGALIAGGASVLGFGSDLGGSVRCPAAFCGVSCLKPTSGRLPLSGQALDGGMPGVVGVYNTLGFLARSAEGIEAAAEEVLGEEAVARMTDDSRFVPLPWRPSMSRSPNRLRIGWSDSDLLFEATPGPRRAVREAVAALRGLGHETVEFRPRHLAEAAAAWFRLVAAEDFGGVAELLRDTPVDDQSLGLSYFFWTAPAALKRALAKIVYPWSPKMSNRLKYSSPVASTSALWDLHSRRPGLVEDVLRHWDEERVDVVITPGFTMPAQRLGYPIYLAAAVGYFAVFNFLNFPAGCVPAGQETEEDQEQLERSYPGFERDLVFGWAKESTRGAAGMPLSVQVVGRPWQEETVVRVMRDIERWEKKRKEEEEEEAVEADTAKAKAAGGRTMFEIDSGQPASKHMR